MQYDQVVTNVCIKYLYRSDKIQNSKKEYYLFVELLFIKSKLIYSYFYILQKNLILTLFSTFVESYLFLK